jgi:hypothetical protein
VGDGAYEPNSDALDFLNKLGESLQEKILVIGRGYESGKVHSYCEFIGYLSENEIYKTKDIHLAPIRIGAGIKTKVALPLFLGMRVVAFTRATNGLKPSYNLYTADSIEEFTKEIIKLRGDKTWKFEGHKSDLYLEDQSDELRSLLSRLST